MTRYAETTSVPVERSRVAIEGILSKYGATALRHDERGRQERDGLLRVQGLADPPLPVPMPPRTDKRFARDKNCFLRKTRPRFLGEDARRLEWPRMAGVGELERYRESRVRERRMAGFKHWEEIQVRLQHRWPIRRVIAWHQRKYPGEPSPARMTLLRYVKSKPPGWFFSRLVLAESGTRTFQWQLVAERQAELLETMIMRLQAALKFEKEMNGILVPEVRKNFDLLNRMLLEHFRVQQAMGVEPKHESMAPAAPRETGVAALDRMAQLVSRIVDLPKEEFLSLLHAMF